MKNAKQFYIDKIKAIASNALSEGRKFTPDEKRQVEEYADRVKEIAANEELNAGIDAAAGSVATGEDGPAPESGPSVLVRKARNEPGFLTGTRVSVGYKAIITDVGSAAPSREGGIEPLPLDARFAYPNIPTRDLGDATRVEYLRQSARALASVSVNTQ